MGSIAYVRNTCLRMAMENPFSDFVDKQIGMRAFKDPSM